MSRICYPIEYYMNPSRRPLRGRYIPLEEFNRMLDDYYNVRGWDINTGLPTKGKLRELGLDAGG